jgi:hypothetical protein
MGGRMNSNDDFAYEIIGWLNDIGRTHGGVFYTSFGVLHIWQGKFGWEYCYYIPEELPEDFIRYRTRQGEMP